MDENQLFMKNLEVDEVPWHRLSTPYGRATEFPKCFNILFKMENMDKVKEALFTLESNTEHQSTLWHSAPFTMIFLAKLFERAAAKYKHNKAAHYIVESLLDFFGLMVECFHDIDSMENTDPLERFEDMLNEDYLWSEEYDEEEDEMRYEDGEVFSDDLFYSFYYYSYQAVVYCKPILKHLEDSPFKDSVKELLELL